MVEVFDVEDYVERATQQAIAGVTSGLDRRGGRLRGTDSWQDENGYWLRVRASMDARPGVEVHFARVLLRSDGPDKDAETEGIIYGSAFVERLLTRLPADPVAEGVVEL